jgi:hypothetical protein
LPTEATELVLLLTLKDAKQIFANLAAQNIYFVKFTVILCIRPFSGKIDGPQR